MFFKKAICIALTLFSLFTALSAMKRDPSFNFEADLVTVNDSGEDIVLAGFQAPPVTPRSQISTPNSQPDNPRITPTEQNYSPKPTLSPLFIPNGHNVSSDQIADPTVTPTPPTSPSEPYSSTKSGSCQKTPTENFLIAPVNVPQQIPVVPITPSAITPIVAATVLAHTMVLAATKTPAPAAILTDQQRLTLQTQLSSLRSNNPPPTGVPTTSQTLYAAQYPMQLPPIAPAGMRQKTGSCGDLSITIAPASPVKLQTQERDKSTGCCMPFSCCGKQLKSCVIL